MIENHGLTHGIRQLCGSSVEAFDQRPALFGIESSGPKIHGEYSRGLYFEIIVGRLLKHIAPDKRIMKQRVFFSVAQCLYRLVHGLIERDLGFGVEFLNRLRSAFHRP